MRTLNSINQDEKEVYIKEMYFSSQRSNKGAGYFSRKRHSHTPYIPQSSLSIHALPENQNNSKYALEKKFHAIHGQDQKAAENKKSRHITKHQHRTGNNPAYANQYKGQKLD